MPSLCPASSSPRDLTDACVRAVWSAIAPAILVVFIGVYSVPIPAPARKVTRILKRPYQRFLTLSEAEAYDARGSDTPTAETNSGEAEKQTPPRWLTLILSGIALAETGAWLGVAAYTLAINRGQQRWDAARAGLLAFSWLYAALKPALRPSATPALDLFALYVLHLLGAILSLGGSLFDHGVIGTPLPSPSTLVLYTINLAAAALLVLLMLSRPLAVPSTRVNKDDVGRTVSPEDYTTLWGWLSFSWVGPLVSRGTSTTLNEEDVWKLSVTMRARPVFLKFSELTRTSLLRQLWASNSLDLIIDFLLTFVSVLFNYSGPFFLKRIIDAIDAPSADSSVRRMHALVYAVLMLCGQVLKSEADVQHLWHGRRAATRIRSELMSAIYDKALKRRDFSGVVNKDRKEEREAEKKAEEGKAGGNGKGKDKDKKADKKADAKEKERKAKADDPKAGADVGKIVNLMAGDANRIAMITSGMYFIYGAPFEIIIAGTFLYQLLGWSAFSGFLVLLLGWPLNSYIARRSIRIQKGVLAARDKRMGVLNEIIGAVKFIKFFAWEDRWISRALEARKKEIAWMVKARVNSVMFQLLWTTAPILISIISFFTYVAQGNELTVGTAFTAIALFDMVRRPLNVIPAWIVQILQTRVAMQRIETFLNEEEVDEQVSTIKRTQMGPSAPTHKELGLRNASFKWNIVETKEEEKDKKDGKKVDTKKPVNGSGNGTDIEAEAGSSEDSSLSETDHRFELRDISVVFPEGELSVITGPTASGKTALLLAILGEMTLLPGGQILMSKEPEKVDEYGLMHAISYAAQTPWLQHQSIKENILFGNPYDESRYNDVVECCALLPDLKILEDGDETEIGARGVSLSGGQKARVALARAVYARTKYVLLDDPLSAVDSHTSRFLYERLFLGPLMRHRTVILVTHHVELVLPGTYYLVRMLDGRIDVQGLVKELRASGALDHITLEASLEAQEESQEKEDKEDKTTENKEGAKGPSEIIDGAAAGETAKDKAKKARKLVKDEERETGSVKWAIYKTYLKASSYWTWAILVLLIVLVQGLSFTEKFWIKIWGEAYGQDALASISHLFISNSALEQHALMSDVISPHHFVQGQQNLNITGFLDRFPPAQEKPLFYVGVYALIGMTTVLVSITSVITLITGALRASRKLFKELLVTVVRATMRWHDVTPTGRMLNRFSKDIETVDTSLASSLQAVNSSLASFASSMVVVVVVFPPFVIPATFIGYFYYRLAIGYLNTGRDLRRMESTTRSPIFSGFGELLEGIVTVRAFSAEPRFLNGLYGKIDVTLRMWYSFWMTNRWLLLRFDCLGALAVFTTTLFALSMDPTGREGWAGWAALCITSAMAFTSNIYWACRFWTQLELDLNSVERVVEYLELPQEPPAIIENSRPPAHWPSSTGPNSESLLVVEDLEVRYAPELPAVLHDISFSLKARERIGLLGRTGSGKSTLAMSILRFVDPTKGKIIIDGIDISSIGIHDLRSRLTFIPQDATLFSGTLRDNLDPFGDYSETDCLDALYRVQMIAESSYVSQRSSRAPSIHEVEREESDATVVAPTTASSSKAPSERTVSPSSTTTEVDREGAGKGPSKITLDTEVSAGGLNFSAGQRQLIAMARALLRQSAVIVLDEATSSIDFETDSKIQKTIREEFGGSLLLTIAHRLRTVIDYDRLIVLDAGQVAEFDTPYNLIRKEGGIFRGMCLKSGSFAELEESAKTKANRDAGSA